MAITFPKKGGSTTPQQGGGVTFPKTQSAACLLTDAPSTVEKAQLDELKIESTHKED